MNVAGLAVVAALASAGCATGLPLTQLGDETPGASNSERCGTLMYAIGMLINTIAIAGDVAFGDTIDGYDALLFVPLGLDAALGTGLQISCHDSLS